MGGNRNVNCKRECILIGLGIKEDVQLYIHASTVQLPLGAGDTSAVIVLYIRVGPLKIIGF